jgi:hypothetical protein
LTIRVTERGRDLLLALLASSKPLTQKQLLVALGRGWTLPDVDWSYGIWPGAGSWSLRPGADMRWSRSLPMSLRGD